MCHKCPPEHHGRGYIVTLAITSVVAALIAFAVVAARNP
jgi:hypothetical protein